MFVNRHLGSAEPSRSGTAETSGSTLTPRLRRPDLHVLGVESILRRRGAVVAEGVPGYREPAGTRDCCHLDRLGHLTVTELYGSRVMAPFSRDVSNCAIWRRSTTTEIVAMVSRPSQPLLFLENVVTAPIGQCRITPAHEGCSGTPDWLAVLDPACNIVSVGAADDFCGTETG